MVAPSASGKRSSILRTIGLSVVALALVGQMIGCSPAVPPSDQGGATAATPVKVTSPQRGPISATLSFTADVRARSQVNIVAAVPGRLDKLLVDVGSQVNAGDIIAEQDHSILDAQVRQAEGNLAAAKAKLAGMQEGSRQETLAQARANLHAAQQRLEALKKGPRPEVVAQAQANLNAAEARLAQL